MNTGQLLELLCEGAASETVALLTPWITQSRRFQSFAHDNGAKIRKKLRTAATAESLQGVLLELDVARRLVEDRHCRVEYERYGQGRVRSPDLTVTYRTNTLLHLEVTHVQGPTGATPEWDGKLLDVLGRKLGQMMPGGVNLLVVGCGGDALSAADVSQSMKRLKSRIEKRDGGALSRLGADDPSEFFQRFQWLSGIVVWRGGVWTNPQAKRPVPTEVLALLSG